jgi:pimeloyl-ACP methyl ester carboxylesterase
MLRIRVVALALTATLPCSVTGQTLRAENAPNQFLGAGATTFAYRSFGAGSPVVFLNRFRATMDHWDPDFLNAVARNHRVIVFDNTGVSLSTGQAPETFAGMADDTARFVRALGVDRVDVVGWSIGGMVAQALLVRHPEIVRTAALLATMPPGGTPERFPPLSEDVRRIVARPGQGTDDDFLFLFFAPSKASRASGRESLARLGRRAGPASPPVAAEMMRRQIAALMDWYGGAGGIVKSFGRIDRPVIVANGHQDAFFSAQQSLALAREIPTARLVIYPDSGHAFMFQYPESFGRLLVDFFADGR